jgi:hypothetical protein
MIAAFVLLATIVAPQCTVTPTPRPKTPTPTATATVTPTWAPPTPTPTVTPTPHYIYTPPTPYPTATTTPTQPPGECGTFCVQSFLQVGDYYLVPELDAQLAARPFVANDSTQWTAWRVERILPSGWVQVVDDKANGQAAWFNLALVKVIVPVMIAGAQ